MKEGIFILQVGDAEPEFHETREDAIAAARQALCDMLDPREFSWHEDAGFITVAEVIALSDRTNIVERPPDELLDDEGFDAEGIEWPPGAEYICDYELIEFFEDDDSENANALMIH